MRLFINTIASLLLIGLLAACNSATTGSGAAGLTMSPAPTPNISPNPQPPLAPFVGLLFL